MHINKGQFWVENNFLIAIMSVGGKKKNLFAFFHDQLSSEFVKARTKSCFESLSHDNFCHPCLKFICLETYKVRNNWKSWPMWPQTLSEVTKIGNEFCATKKCKKVFLKWSKFFGGLFRPIWRPCAMPERPDLWQNSHHATFHGTFGEFLNLTPTICNSYAKSAFGRFNKTASTHF